jgi:C-terminal processing protease CtpA/Prc
MKRCPQYGREYDSSKALCIGDGAGCMRWSEVNMVRRIFFLFFFILLGTFGAAAQNMGTAPAETVRIQRLSELAKVWGTVKFFHPFLAYRSDIDWDRALVETIPKVNEARSPEEFASALNGMLATLEDPSTRASVGTQAEKRANADVTSTPITLQGDILMIDGIGAARAIATANNRANELFGKTRKMVSQAKAVILDLRSPVDAGEEAAYYLGFYVKSVLPAMIDRKITLSSSRYRMHNGYAPQTGGTSGGYFSGLVTDTPETLIGTASKSPRLVLLVNDMDLLAPTLAGLQAGGAAFVIHDGPSKGEGGAGANRMKLSENVVVQIRNIELVNSDGTTGFRPDAIASPGQAVEVAHRLITENKFDSIREKTTPAYRAQTSQADKTYPEMEFPSNEYRLLALFRFWNVMNLFFPYKHLTDKPWADVLPKYIPKFEQNLNSGDYQLTVSEMVAEMQDSHGGVRAPSQPSKVAERIGLYYPGVAVRFVGEDPMVSYVADKNAGVGVGDVVTAIDGETVSTYSQKLARYIAHSTPQALRRSLQFTLLRGAKDSKVTLTLKGLRGKTRDVTLTRSLAGTDPIWSQAAQKEPKQPVFGVLPSGYGYVDLVRLTVGDVDKMFETIMKTPGAIFDMRGYPQGTAWSIAPRLTGKKGVTGALFTRPIWMGGEAGSGDPTNFSFAQKLPEISGEVYKGKVVMLIDENAISQSEHTALFFEAATDVTFIGTPTVGANGDVTRMTLPGNLVVGFTGHDVRHADGRQLQRIGIQPHVTVRPTVKGVIAGRDEVLESAVKFLQSRPGKPK